MFSRLTRFFNPPTDGHKAPARVFWVALVVRLLYMTLAHQYKVKPLDSNFGFGYEAGRIAQSLATGFGYSDAFSNPYLHHTGPTAWLPPVYPLLLAGVFKLFGVYTRASAWVILAINCVFSAWTAMATWELGARLANRRVALWSGWLWALYPAAMQYAVKWIWEMSITTALFAWVVVLAMRMRAQPAVRPLRRWAWFGLAWALIGMSNSTLLIFLPVCGVWLLLGVYKDAPMLRSYVVGAALSGVIFLTAIAPWTLRNWEVFHAFIPMRGNFGVELYLGNGPGSNGMLMAFQHPYESHRQLQLYKNMGEVAYVKMRGGLAKEYIASDPMHFVRNTVMRVYYFWVSVPHPSDEAWFNEWGRVVNFCFTSLAGLLGLALALKRKLPGAALWAWAFLLLPIPYYIVTVHARFRHPLEPMICVLGVYLFQSAERRSTRNRRDVLGRWGEAPKLQSYSQAASSVERIEPSSLARISLEQTMRWCQLQELVGTRGMATAPDYVTELDAQLRTECLQPTGQFDYKDSAADSKMVNDVIARRSRLLAERAKSEPLLDSNPSGLLLLYFPHENLACGAARVASNGFFDDDNVPPWDTWVHYADGKLICWVPASLVPLAHEGIGANPEQCIQWA